MATAVDLAGTSSAAVRVVNGEVVWQCDSHQFFTEREFAMKLIGVGGGKLYVEDLPPGLRRFDINAKNVLRLQGRLIHLAEDNNVHIVFVQFSKWSSIHGRINRRKSDPLYETTATWAKNKCIELGYTPPDNRGSLTTVAGVKSKLLQDYRDAYLLAVAAETGKLG
jgi:hypothetical protein